LTTVYNVLDQPTPPDLPPVVQPELIRDGRLVEVMPEWHFPAFDLSVVHFEQPPNIASGPAV
jgi:hypothetical protein